MKIPVAALPARIHLVDALRGFALIGIFLLHAIEHFDLLLYPKPASVFLAKLDLIIHDILFFIFAGKAYSIFSILFGLSFYIQWKNYEARNKAFTGYFIKRLLVLFFMGYLLSLIYIGEILTAFALLGFLLLLLNRLTKKWLLIIAVVFLSQFPTLFLLRLSFTVPGFNFQQDWSAWQNVFYTFSKGSLWDVIRFNAFDGHLAKWQYFYNVGRYLQLVGLFTIGLMLGRMRYFENIQQHLSFTKRVALISGMSFLVLYGCSFFVDANFNPSQAALIKLVCESYSSLFFTFLLMSLFVLISIEWNSQSKTTLLSAYGKMSLTNYIVQPLIGVPLFYGFGCGLYEYLGITYSFLTGVCLVILQLLFSSWWLKRFEYGPFEWLWRKAAGIHKKSK